MGAIMTPWGVLETNIPTLYGSKHQFKTPDGLTFDIPDWVGWLALVGGLIGGGALGGYLAWNARGLFNIGQTASGVLGGITKFFSPGKTK